MLVRLRHAQLHPIEYPIFVQALGFSLYLRDNSTLLNRILKSSDEWANLVRQMRSEMCVKDRQQYPSNLRVYPPMAELDEQMFTKYLHDYQEKEKNEAMTLVKEIFKHGI